MRRRRRRRRSYYQPAGCPAISCYYVRITITRRAIIFSGGDAGLARETGRYHLSVRNDANN